MCLHQSRSTDTGSTRGEPDRAGSGTCVFINHVLQTPALLEGNQTEQIRDFCLHQSRSTDISSTRGEPDRAELSDGTSVFINHVLQTSALLERNQTEQSYQMGLLSSSITFTSALLEGNRTDHDGTSVFINHVLQTSALLEGNRTEQSYQMGLLSSSITFYRHQLY